MVRRRSAARAFTLIELLVVIAVILILASLLMPSLDQATRQARRTACISNCHQIYLSLAHYAQNFKNLLPRSVLEYYYISGLFDSVPALRPYVDDPRVLYCTLERIGPLPDIDRSVGAGGDYAGWNLYGQPGVYHVLSNIAVFFNPAALYDYAGYDDNKWAIGIEWRHPLAALVSHRRVMRYNLQVWDPADWRCQNWYPHGDYHDVTYGDGRNETHSKAQWQAKPRLWFDWGGADRHNVFY
jgi:prepilin-type N-terminal cleavage/methylation domain-containing protein